MARDVTFTDKAWGDYLWWQEHDPAMLKRINALIRECQRTPFIGTGKPEALKRNLSGFWSRRITLSDRLVYEVSANAIVITACRFHYD